MEGSALGAPGEQIKEGEEGVAVTTFDEPDEELRGPPPQPLHRSGSAPRCPPVRLRLTAMEPRLRAKGSYAALSGLLGVPAPRGALRLASKPFVLNAAPSAYLDTLLSFSRAAQSGILGGLRASQRKIFFGAG
jgi:hypothetical protein